MTEEKKNLKKSFGRSFENAYLSTNSEKSANPLLYLQVPKKINKKVQKKSHLIAGVSDPKIRKELENKLAQSERLAGIGILASGIANEINNPLAGIMGYAEIMINEKNPRQIKKYAKKIVQEANKASEIISWITRYTQGAKDGDISELNIQEIIDESLDAVRHTRRSGDIHIIKEFPRVPNIKGNRTELQQVFVNLFDNAVEAMDTGGVLDVSTHFRGGCLEIRVSDSGTGIPSEDLKHIFEPFFTTKEGLRGTGLGLFVTSMMIKKHNGEISCTSKVGKGTTFTIRLPVSNEGEPGEDIDENKRKARRIET